ncbi:MAG: ABC transporter ATP-binding protein [Desulfurella sp.]|jgi:branched-chain amino acid transport system ATP-binding protein|uniref:Branched-chain amino acid transport system ATP-binding protein n=1 Tax=Desulfurella multipotens TaxID=79269 RepID=A0A1G6Q0W4_9BACT|nr:MULTISPECIES: ABC transporter ATP-binding protein [Desulfurella]PMP68612.1 MAG: ABC transporter ATP-binding protein [Desulfurella multipotens]PMP90897.1 MAG: ABC transporter ATP-binding protein [Desulfurella sp.]SDC85285.1 branched-chain amino acid transport system ATP-binding protein [Desulfurella multipotens]HEX13274.1 ABC transporter ATP-binding protein [Desulfurella acetivorans]
MLKVKNLNVFYKLIHAVNDISFEVPESKIVTLIGPNGAGKSSTLKSIVGLVASSGQINFLSHNISKEKTYQRIKRGIALVPEGRKVFVNLTVLENLRIGAFNKPASTLEEKYERIFQIFPILKKRAKQYAGTLSGGEQQMLALGRALMSEPSLLMLDEPSLGLAPKVVQEVFEIIQHLNREGMTILLVEQNAAMALKIAHYGYVLEAGKIVLEDIAQNLLQNEEVRKSYLGEV